MTCWDDPRLLPLSPRSDGARNTINKRRWVITFDHLLFSQPEKAQLEPIPPPLLHFFFLLHRTISSPSDCTSPLIQSVQFAGACNHCNQPAFRQVLIQSRQVFSMKTLAQFLSCSPTARSVLPDLNTTVLDELCEILSCRARAHFQTLKTNSHYCLDKGMDSNDLWTNSCQC